MSADPDPTILTFLGTYLPGFKGGGPIRSIGNLVNALGGEFCFRVVTLDRDCGEKLPFPGIVANRWVRVGRADVMYLRPGLRCFLAAWALLRSVDRHTVLYLNGFFDWRFSLPAVFMHWLKLCRPRCVLLAPRGEFSSGAMHFKRLRKLSYIRISRWLGLYKYIIWHASSDLEAADVRRQFPLVKRIGVAGVIPRVEVSERKRRPWGGVAIASDIAGIESPLDRQIMRSKKQGQLRAVFVSRIARMKNLSGALRMLEGVSGDVSFNIYGPQEDAGYWEECQGLIAALPTNIRVQYCGQIEHERIWGVFAENDLFLFPTLGENYGHVICEALAAGCPVLISDQTPWRDLEKERAGWAFPHDETERFRSVLQQCVDADDKWYAALSARAMKYGVKRSSDPEMIAANRRLLQQASAL
jgi:glycosyltransferase involved in cell wall biosynthesis